MATTNQPDNRIPIPMSGADYQTFLDFMLTASERTTGLYDLTVDDVKKMKKTSQDDLYFIDDVIDEMSSPTNKVASNVKVSNIQAARLAGTQNRKLGDFFTALGQLFTRNATQSEGYAYQHSATYEMDVESAIRSNVKGANATKEKLESNRKKRNAAAAATRAANAKLAEEETAKKAEEETAKNEKSA